MNAVIVTARQPIPGRPDKNLAPVAGRPLVSYPIQAAFDSRLGGKVYLSTDGDRLAEVGAELGCHVLRRSPEQSGDVPHAGVIAEAVRQVQADLPGLELVTVLLGNTVHLDGAIIDTCLEILATRPELTGCCTVWQAQDDHPYRAMQVDLAGHLMPFGGVARRVSSNRQSYPPACFYDQGPWCFRPEWSQRDDGPSPWTWLGPRVHPVVRDWVTGRDVHGELDMAVSEWWVTR